MDELISEFIAEAREMIAALEYEVVAWETAPHDRARLDAIFRFVHTVKGNSGFFDLPRLTALSHAAEDALADVRSGRREADHGLVSAVLAAVDRIGELIEAVESGVEMPPCDASLIAALAEGGEVRAAAPARTAPARTVRLPVELLDRMMNGISDLVLARNALAREFKSVTVTTMPPTPSSACPRRSPMSAKRSPAPACSGSKACSPPCRAWFATSAQRRASRSRSGSTARMSSSTAK
jgi:two-component system chemotaxis sensor kinase CheA